MAATRTGRSSISSVYVQVVPSFDGLTNAISRGMAPVSQTMSRSMGSRMSEGFMAYGEKAGRDFTTGLKRVAQGAALTVGAALAVSLGKGFKRFTAIENAEAAMIGLGRTGEEVDAIYKAALGSVTGTMFDLGDAMSAGSMASSAGVAISDMEDYLKRLVNTATIAQAPLNEIASIIGKVQTGGYASTDEVNQLSDRNLSIWTQLSEDLGLSQKELKKLISDGGLTAEMLYKSLDNVVGNSADVMGNTLTSMIAKFGSAQGRFGAEFIKASAPGLKMLLTEGIAFYDVLTSKVGPALANLAAEYLPRISNYFSGKGTDWGMKASQAIPVIREYIAQLERIVKEVLPIIEQKFKTIEPIIRSVLGYIASNADTIVPLVFGFLALRTAVNLAAAVIVPLIRVFGALKGAMLFLRTATIAPAILAAGPYVALAAALGGVGYLIWQRKDEIMRGLEVLAYEIDLFAEGVGDAVTGWFGGSREEVAAWSVEFNSDVNGAISTATSKTSEFFSWANTQAGIARQNLLDAPGETAGWFARVFTQLGGQVSRFGSWVSGFFSGVWGNITGGFWSAVNAVGGFVNYIGGILSSVGNNIASSFNSAVSSVVGFATSLWGGLRSVWDGIGSLFGGLGNTIVGALQSGVNALFGMLNGIIGLVNQAISGINSVTSKKIAGRQIGPTIGTIPNLRIPQLATGADVMGPTIALIGEKDPETVVNRGLMNEQLAAVTRRLDSDRGMMGSRRYENLTVQVIAAPEQDIGAIAQEVVRVIADN